MTPFLVQAIQQIQAKHLSWEEVVVVLPSKRAGVFFKHYLLQHIDRPQIAPTIHSIEGFVESLSSLKKASPTHQLFALYGVYTKQLQEHQRDDFTAFLQWGKRLLNDFNDLDAYRIDPEAILHDLGEFYRIESVFSTEEERSFSPAFWSALPQLYTAFENTLMEANWGTLGMLYKDTLDSLELYLSHTQKTHYFIGFNALNKAEQDLIQGFLVEKKGAVIWDLDQTFHDDQFHAAGRFIRHYQTTWPFYRQNPLSFQDTSFQGPKEIKAVGFSGNIAQAQYVGKLLKETNSTKETTAVVFGEEQLLLPALAHLPEGLEQWNVTMGYAIEQLPISQWFMTLVQLHAQYTEEGYDRDLLLQLLHYTSFGEYAAKVSEEFPSFVKTVTANFSTKVSPELLSSSLKNELGLTIVEESTLLIDQFTALLQNFSALKGVLDNMSQAVVAQVLKLLAQIRVQLEGVDFDVKVSAFFVLLKEGMAMQTLDFKGDPIEGIQLMGMLESRVLDFDRLIITNVNEGILPVGKNDQSFFPFAMKKKYGLPTFLDNDAIYTYHFYRLLQRAKEVHLLYNAKSEGLGAGEKSRFIRQLELCAQPQHHFSDEQWGVYFPNSPEKINEVVKTQPMLQRLAAIAEKGFSPTSLTTYLNNPMTFYDRYILGIKELETPTKVLSHITRGTIVHDCVEQLYTPFIGRVLQPADYDAMQARLEETLAKIYAETYPNMPVPKGENYLTMKAYQRGIQQFLKAEKGLVEAGNELVIIALEKEFAVPLEVDIAGQKILLRGKIDRVDQFNGTTRLIDYKTGKVEKPKLYWNNWEAFVGDYKRNPLFQLLVYAWAHLHTAAQSAVEVGIISFKSPKENVLPLVRKDVPKGANQAEVDAPFAAEIHKYLVQLIEELFDLEKSFVSLEEDR